jgi:hypothetical protein
MMFNKTKTEIIEKSKSVKNLTIFKWKKFIKKRALKRIEKNLKYLQKKEEDFTIEEMRELIAKEEKEVISQITTTVGISTILALLGIPNI